MTDPGIMERMTAAPPAFDESIRDEPDPEPEPLFRAVLAVTASRLPKGQHWRLRVELDEDGDLVLAEEQMTSHNAGARDIASGANVTRRIEFLDEEVDWLIAQVEMVKALRVRRAP
jgi:hypothetical protein